MTTIDLLAGQLADQLERGRQLVEELLRYRGQHASLCQPDAELRLADGIDLDPVMKTSELALRGFATLATDLSIAIRNVLKDCRAYVHDRTRNRPHTLLIVAPPGSGKSHLVRCMAESLGIPSVSGDLSAPDAPGMLAYVINQAKRYTDEDTIPLIFLDEVDSDSSLYPTLLPLLYDGELFGAGQLTKLGKCIVVCAANDLRLALHPGPAQTGTLAQPAPSDKKGALQSRLNAGVLKVESVNSRERALDKVVVAAKLIKRRFTHATHVSIGLLQFLGQMRMEHELRSLEFFINLIPADVLHRHPEAEDGGMFEPNDALLSLSRTYNWPLHDRITTLLSDADQPTNPLVFHVSPDDVEDTKSLWTKCAANVDLLCL